MTVYLVCNPATPVDLTPVKNFGELVVINDRFVYSDELTEDGRLPKIVRNKLENVALDFSLRDDYLMLGGDHVQFVYMAALLARRSSQFRVLRWDRPARGYVPVTFDIWA